LVDGKDHGVRRRIDGETEKAPGSSTNSGPGELELANAVGVAASIQSGKR
jgi:hypothetical protein